MKGSLLVLGAGLSFALSDVLVAPLLARFRMLALTAAVSLPGTLALAPLASDETIEALAPASPRDVALLLRARRRRRRGRDRARAAAGRRVR